VDAGRVRRRARAHRHLVADSADGIVASRKPDDISAFNAKMIELFAQAVVKARAREAVPCSRFAVAVAQLVEPRVVVPVVVGSSPIRHLTVPTTAPPSGRSSSPPASRGGQLQVFDQPTSDPNQDGTVVDEDPAPGTRIPSGSEVAIYVARA
jgi:PASTA domain